MIQPLRTIHRWVFTCFAALLPALVVIAVAERHQYVQAGQIRVELLSSTPIISQRGLFRLNVFDGEMELNATSSTPRPEVLIYWSSLRVEGGLPPDARLLGASRPGMHYELPSNTSGTVLLFSPATNSVIDSIPISRSR
jgi:hypothetical protein